LTFVDFLEMDYLQGPHVIVGDFLEESTIAKINAILNGRKVDVLLSDMVCYQ
jgi:23S rRNA U2552 (ribose-2'-O)-methylase RlmE/FtsJ